MKPIRCKCGRLLYKCKDYPEKLELYCHGCKGIILTECGEITNIKTREEIKKERQK
jgi:hypothetical protein